MLKSLDTNHSNHDSPSATNEPRNQVSTGHHGADQQRLVVDVVGLVIVDLRGSFVVACIQNHFADRKSLVDMSLNWFRAEVANTDTS